MACMIAEVLAGCSLAVSVLALWLNYRTRQRQRLAEDPVLVASWLRRRNGVVAISNVGPTAAVECSARSVRGTFIRWNNQRNEAEFKQNDCGEVVGGLDPWTPDCGGETRTIWSGGRVCIVLANDVPANEALQLTFRNYMRRLLKVSFEVSSIFCDEE